METTFFVKHQLRPHFCDKYRLNPNQALYMKMEFLTVIKFRNVM